MLDLCVRSLEMYHSGWVTRLCDEGGPVEYRQIGTLEIALEPEHASRLQHAAGGRWIEPGDVARAFPFLSPTCGAVATAEHGYVDPPQLAAALGSSAVRRHADFRRGRVEAISRDGSGVAVTLNGSRIAADTVVLAAGAWTNQIIGVRRPPLRPVRGQLARLRGSGLMPLPTILWGPDCYIVPRDHDGTILVGATVEEAGFDERTTSEGIGGLLSAAERLMPGLTPDRFIDGRVGLRPATTDELPVIGPDPEIPGLLHASGHYRNGVLLAPITATLIADLVAGKPADPIIEAFRPDRFPGAPA
jgi:glycine oxidase